MLSIKCMNKYVVISKVYDFVFIDIFNIIGKVYKNNN